MRRGLVVVGLVSGALLVPAAPASAHVMDCRSHREAAQQRGASFLDHLTKQYLKAIEPFDQVDEQDTFTGTLGACTAGRARLITRRVGRKVVKHKHPVLHYRYEVSQAGRDGNYVKQTVVYTIKLEWRGRSLLAQVLRPSGQVAVGGEPHGGPILPDIEPLT